jgi:hypothetical protein
MAEDPPAPPWEWVDGDPVWSSRFTFITGLLMGGAAVLLVLTTLFLFGEVTISIGSPIPLVLQPLLIWAFTGPALLILWLLPRRVPVLGRIGISPVGVRLVLPVRNLTILWSSVRRIGPDWVDLSGAPASRYRLTPLQARRLTHFVAPWLAP